MKIKPDIMAWMNKMMLDGRQAKHEAIEIKWLLAWQRNKRRADNDGGIEQSGYGATIFDFGCNRISSSIATNYCDGARR